MLRICWVTTMKKHSWFRHMTYADVRTTIFCARASAPGMVIRFTIYEARYYCFIFIPFVMFLLNYNMWNKVVVKAHGGCCCPGNYFVPEYEHLAWWLYPRHINQILSCYIYIYILYLCWITTCGIESWLRHMADVVVLVTVLSRYISTWHDDYIRDI